MSRHSTNEEKIKKIQESLKQEQIEAWLFYNFRESNIFATRILDLPSHIHQTRRYFYLVPANGTPKKLLHAIEAGNLDSLPGEKEIYLSWQSLSDGLKKILSGYKQVAMEYSPLNAIPYVSNVDGGTIELVRSCGVDVISSANLVQYFEARWDEEQRKDNFETATHLREIVDLTFGMIKKSVSSGSSITEYDVQQFMLAEFKKRDLITEDDPNCSVNINSANPHYEPTAETHLPIKKGDFVLIDLWAKKNKPNSVYADITWTGYVGEEVPDEYKRVFQVVRAARDAALNLARKALAEGKEIYGSQLDDAARDVIVASGYGEYFIHRTGHSIGQMIHGNGANLDNLETKDDRKIIPLTSFSIEPGIYIPGKFGIRSEIDVYVSASGEVVVTGEPMQEHVVPILS